MFAPSGVAIENAVKGKDCFTLSGTIERLLERRNTTESSLADSYLAHIGSADKQHQDQLLRGNNGEEGQENNRIISHLKESKEPSRLEAAREGDRGDSPAGRGGNSDKANGSSSPHPGKPNAVQTSPSHGPDALKEPITITNGNEDEGDENEDEDEGSEDDSDDDKDALSGQHEGASRSSRKNFRIKISMGPSKDKNGKGQRSAADDNDKNGDNLASAVRGKSDSEDELKDISEPLSNNNSDEESAYESVEETKSKKRKRGRPQREETVVKRKRGRPKRKRGTSPQPSPSGKKTREQANEAIDLSWKDGGKNFPKRISRVGAKYNATFIEAAGTWKENESTI